MAKKIVKSTKKDKPPEENQVFLGVDSQYVALFLYIGSSVAYFFQPSPFVPLIIWLLGLLTFQYCKQNFLSFHALQSSAINLVAVVLRFGSAYFSTLLINQVEASGGGEEILLERAQQMGWVTIGITIILLLLQIYGAETALRGLKKRIPVVYSLGRSMAKLFFDETEEEE